MRPRITKELYEQVLLNKRTAINELDRNIRAIIVSRRSKYVPNLDDYLDDLVQSSITLLLKKLPSWNATKASFNTYAYGLIEHRLDRFLNQYRFQFSGIYGNKSNAQTKADIEKMPKTISLDEALFDNSCLDAHDFLIAEAKSVPQYTDIQAEESMRLLINEIANEEDDEDDINSMAVYANMKIDRRRGKEDWYQLPVCFMERKRISDKLISRLKENFVTEDRKLGKKRVGKLKLQGVV